MNILHMKYAVEVARHGSISKAADELLIAQANLSRSIKALEADLGISIFDRSFKGMVLTPEGEEFISYAEQILDEIDEMEQRYKAGTPVHQQFSISVPHSGYIAEAFSHFIQKIGTQSSRIFYLETNTATAIANVISSDYKLGVIRYAESFDSYYKELLAEKGLSHEVISEFHTVVLMNRENPLAERETLQFSDLSGQVQVYLSDPAVSSLPSNLSLKMSSLPESDRQVFFYELGSLLNLLSDNKEAYAWSAPQPPSLLERYGLVQLSCPDPSMKYKDLLIHRKDYRLSRLDRLFISELAQTRRESMNHD